MDAFPVKVGYELGIRARVVGERPEIGPLLKELYSRGPIRAVPDITGARFRASTMRVVLSIDQKSRLCAHDRDKHHREEKSFVS